MSRHTPFIVVPRGAFTDSYIYKCRDSEDPVYDRYAEGPHKNMVELANQLNYIEAEAQSKVVTEQATPEPAVGIPTESFSRAEEALNAIEKHVTAADAGLVNLVVTKERILGEVRNYREDPRR